MASNNATDGGSLKPPFSLCEESLTTIRFSAIPAPKSRRHTRPWDFSLYHACSSLPTCLVRISGGLSPDRQHFGMGRTKICMIRPPLRLHQAICAAARCNSCYINYNIVLVSQSARHNPDLQDFRRNRKRGVYGTRRYEHMYKEDRY